MTLNADPRLLKSLLHNLLDNAWKYTAQSSSPAVEIQCVTSGGATRFSVRDNGVGFDIKYAERIFEPFQRMHSSAEFPGIGIGLATVARIVQRYGGEIRAESAPGKGTVFHFTLPAATTDNREDSLRAAI
jgi:signal transduction histidine kinase